MKIKITDILGKHNVLYELGEIHRKLPDLHLLPPDRFIPTYRLIIVNGCQDTVGIDLTPEEMNVFIDTFKRLA